MRMTVGPLPPAVYWRRRLLVLGGALLIVLLVVWSCGGSGSAKQAGKGKHAAPADHASATGTSPTILSASPSGTPSGSPTTAPSSGALPPAAAPSGPVDSCSDDDMALTAKAARRIPAGSYPTLYLTIRNASSHPCTRDVGAGAQELRIMHGDTRIWSSDDCDAASGKDVRRFDAGVAVTYHFIWDGRTSAKGCHARRTIPPRGDYTLVARLGKILSKPAPFALT